jgi:hypothetical protein
VDVDALRETLLAEPALQIVDREALARLATEAGVLALEYREEATEDAGRVAEVREAVAPVPVVAIPLLRGELRDLTALATLVGYLDAAR